MLSFLTVFTLILLAGHYYVGRRLLTPLKLKPSYKKLAWTAILTVPLILPFTFLFRIWGINGTLIDLIGWIAFVGMGFFSLIIGWVVLRDLILLAGFLIRKYRKPKSYDAQRRAFLMNSMNYSIIGVSALLTGYGIYEARRNPTMERINIHLPHLPPEFEGLRIAQFTDLHVGPTIKRAFVQSAVDQINQLGADIIVFTGDLVDGSVSSLKNEVAPLGELAASEGVYFITGNHEYYSGVNAWLEQVERLGLRVLLDANNVITRGNRKLVMAGVTDFTAHRFEPDHVSDPVKALHGAETADIKILLAHQPVNIFGASQAGYDLQISGHTHGGQYLPWRFMVTLNQPYVIGLNKHKDTWIYVNRGTGYWGPPLRLGVPSEISLLTLTAKNENSA